MRWSNLSIEVDERARLPGYRAEAVVRHFEAPDALRTRFYEVRAKSILNRVPESSRMPFRWTINPYRGCSHACVYCFARPTHAYLGFDAGQDFEREIVVKVNAPELLRSELGRPSWQGEHIALVFRGGWAGVAGRPCDLARRIRALFQRGFRPGGRGSMPAWRGATCVSTSSCLPASGTGRWSTRSSSVWTMSTGSCVRRG